MPISARVVTLEQDGSNSDSFEPCFFAGHDGGTVSDALAGALATKYTSGTMPFVQGEFTITGQPAEQVVLYLDFDL